MYISSIRAAIATIKKLSKYLAFCLKSLDHFSENLASACR